MSTSNPVLCSLQELDVSLTDDIRSCLEDQYKILYETDTDEDAVELARKHVADILLAMKKVQARTICRVNRIVTTREDLIRSLNEALAKWAAGIGLPSNQISITAHPIFDDVVAIGEITSENPNGEKQFILAGCRTLPESHDYPIIFSTWPRRKAKGWPMTHRVVI
jgi:hypothetical protein